MKNVNPIIAKLLAHIESECSAVDREAVFDQCLDECYSFDSVGGPFAGMCPSSVLKEVDPIAHRCGVNDYFGTDDSYTEVAGETYLHADLEEARESFIEDLDADIAGLESEIEDLDAEDDTKELAKKQGQLAEMQADKAEAESYAF